MNTIYFKYKILQKLNKLVYYDIKLVLSLMNRPHDGGMF